MKKTLLRLFLSQLTSAPALVKDPQIIVLKINTTNVILEAKPQYDITQAPTDSIVNPANSYLFHGSGVAEAISKKAGKKLQEWSNAQATDANGVRVPVGKAIISPAFDLSPQGITHIIHTVGPDFRDPVQKKNGAQLVYDAWYNALVAANDKTIISITFPSISTGIFECPQDLAATQAHKAIIDFIAHHPHSSIKTIVIGLWQDTWPAYKKIFEKDYKSGSLLNYCDLPGYRYGRIFQSLPSPKKL